MHDIEENLVGADRLLDCMGYKRVDHSSLVLEQPIDVDAVISVSRDAIVAFVECQVCCQRMLTSSKFFLNVLL